jgi:hypothetical protein
VLVVLQFEQQVMRAVRAYKTLLKRLSVFPHKQMLTAASNKSATCIMGMLGLTGMLRLAA